MSVDQTNIIDLIGVDSASDDVILTIVDQLEWGEDEHLFLLQEKFNTYLRFVESGEILEAFPDSKGRNVLIELILKYPFNQDAEIFFDKITRVVEGAGIKITARVFERD